MKLQFCYELDQAQKTKWEQFWDNYQHAHPRQHFLFGEVEQTDEQVILRTL